MSYLNETDLILKFKQNLFSKVFWSSTFKAVKSQIVIFIVIVSIQGVSVEYVCANLREISSEHGSVAEGASVIVLCERTKDQNNAVTVTLVSDVDYLFHTGLRLGCSQSGLSCTEIAYSPYMYSQTFLFMQISKCWLYRIKVCPCKQLSKQQF